MMHISLQSSPACGRGKGPAMREHRGIGEGTTCAALPLTSPLLRNGSLPLPQAGEDK
jgi:hypothetical protein